MKNIIIAITMILSFGQAFAQCSQPNPDFCPGNYFTNGNFESMSSNPGSLPGDNDINLADGWSEIWQGTGSLADLQCGGLSQGTGFAPIPNSGVYAGMWIINRNTDDNNTYREGMYNRLATPILPDGNYYEFNFDMANSATSYSGAPISVAFYGVYNQTNAPSSNPITHNTPTNLNLWTTPGVEVVLLGVVTSPSPFTNSWTSQTLGFYSSILPTNGITHILITKDDAPNAASWRGAYVNFDNFCLQVAEPQGGCLDCCQTDLEIFNAPGTPNPLPVTQSVHHGIPMSYAKETFVIHEDATIPITEMRVVVTDIQYEYNYGACATCVNNPALWGTIIAPATPIGGANGLSHQNPNYITMSGSLVTNFENKREILWSNLNGVMLQDGDAFEVHYLLPPASEIPCCATSVKICTKIIWKDANCQVCEIPTCSIIELGDMNTEDLSESTETTPSSDSEAESPKCECVGFTPIGNGHMGDGDNFGIRTHGDSEGTSTNLLAYCGGEYPKPYRSINRITYTFEAQSYDCSPKSCNTTFFWEMENSIGAVFKNGSGSTFQVKFMSKGKYKLKLTPYCGGVACPPCVVTFKVGR